MNRTRSGQFPPGVSGNPRGRPPSTRQDSTSTEIVHVGRTVVRNDGYTNAATGHGTSRDRRTMTRFRGTVISDLEGLDLWRSEFLAKRIIEAKPEEAMKRGWSLDCDDKDLCARMAVTADDLDLDETLTHAAQVARACGGSAILPIIEGAQGRLADPLDEEAIGEITALHVFEPRELQALDWYSDLGPKWGRPSMYAFNPLANGRLSYVGGEPIHESRLIIFPGRKITRQTLFGQRESWGDSCLTPVAEVLADFGVSWGSAATLLQHHGKETLQLAGLRDMLAHADGMEEFDRNMSAMYQAWSTLRMNVIDKDSTITRSTGTLAGVHELLAEFKELIAAAGETPMAIVFGTAGTGLRTGDTDMDAWYSTCERWRTKTLAKPHRRLVRMLLNSAAGPSNGNEPERWAIKYPPMSVPSDKEIAETRKMDAERAAVLISNGIVSGDDVAESFFGGEKYSGDIRVNWERREAQAALDMGADDDMEDVEPEVEGPEGDPGLDVEDIDEDELDALAMEDEEDITLDDEDEDEDAPREDGWRNDRAIVRASDGRFGHVAGAHKGKRKPAGGRKAAPKFDAAPHRKVIERHRAAELSNRKASLAIKERMTKIRAAAVGKSKDVRAKAKERLTELAGARDEFRALANEARANRIAASKAMTAARKEHTAKVREERASAKDSKAAKAPKTKAKTAPGPKDKPDDDRALMTDEAVKVNEAARTGDASQGRIPPRKEPVTLDEKIHAEIKKAREAAEDVDLDKAERHLIDADRLIGQRPDGFSTPEMDTLISRARAAIGDNYNKPPLDPKAIKSGDYNDWADHFTGSITQDQRFAIQSYSNHSDRILNPELRNTNGNPDGSKALFEGEHAHRRAMRQAGDTREETIGSEIKALDSAIAAARFPQETKVYRTLTDPEGKLFGSASIGSVFQDHGYVSTTTNRNMLDTWTRGKPGRVDVHITMPKGSNGAPMAKLSQFENEKEILLPRGSRFRITRIEEATATSPRRIHVEGIQ